MRGKKERSAKAVWPHGTGTDQEEEEEEEELKSKRRFRFGNPPFQRITDPEGQGCAAPSRQVRAVALVEQATVCQGRVAGYHQHDNSLRIVLW